MKKTLETEEHPDFPGDPHGYCNWRISWIASQCDGFLLAMDEAMRQIGNDKPHMAYATLSEATKHYQKELDRAKEMEVK